MAEPNSLYSESTTRMHVELHSRVTEREPELTVRVSSSDNAEGLPVWTKESAAQLDQLVKELKDNFGDTQVKVQRASDDTTDREILVRPNPRAKHQEGLLGNHAVQVAAVVKAFVDEHQIELDNGTDEQHFRQMAYHAAQLNPREGIMAILSDPLANNAEKADTILKMLKFRKDQRRGGRGHGQDE